MSRIARRAVALALSVGSLLGGLAAADPVSLPRIYTNEAYVEETIAAPKLAIDDPLLVFQHVLGALPDRVKVYPTENYYYFSFMHNHVRYAGNFRFDVIDRDKGMVHFAYYEDLAEWKDEDPIKHVVLDRRRGVGVEKLGPLSYRVSYGDKSVLFELNDLSQVKPPSGAVGPDEVYLGPIFDESAIRFFLVFNKKLKIFHYVLDETIDNAEKLIAPPDIDRILIGKRTGFAFYRDHKLDRKILIGVFEGNSRINNYFDGPFDQLPDNFLEGEALRDAILAAEPQLKGKIDRYGISPGGNDRYLIAPYRHYRTDDDLVVFHSCATNKNLPADHYYECFVFDDDSTNVRANLVKLPVQKRRSRPNNGPPKRP